MIRVTSCHELLLFCCCCCYCVVVICCGGLWLKHTHWRILPHLLHNTLFLHTHTHYTFTIYSLRIEVTSGSSSLTLLPWCLGCTSASEVFPLMNSLSETEAQAALLRCVFSSGVFLMGWIKSQRQIMRMMVCSAGQTRVYWTTIAPHQTFRSALLPVC